MSNLISEDGRILNLKNGNSVKLSLLKKAVSPPINATIGGLVALWGIGILPPGNIQDGTIQGPYDLYSFWLHYYKKIYFSE